MPVLKAKPGSGNGKKEAKRSVGRASNRDVLDMLVRELDSSRRLNREIRDENRSRNVIGGEILTMLRLIRQDLSLVPPPTQPQQLTPELIAQIVEQTVTRTVHATLIALGIAPKA